MKSFDSSIDDRVTNEQTDSGLAANPNLDVWTSIAAAEFSAEDSTLVFFDIFAVVGSASSPDDTICGDGDDAARTVGSLYALESFRRDSRKDLLKRINLSARQSIRKFQESMLIIC